MGLAAAALLLSFAIVTPLDLRAQAALGAIVFGAALVLNRFAGRGITLLLIALSVGVSTRYFFWRISSTLSLSWTPDGIAGGVLLLAEFYAFSMLLLGYFQSLLPLERRPVPLPEDPGAWPTVDLFIPTYNEPLEVVRATVIAAKAIDWPAGKLRIHLLDDGRRDEFRAFASRVGVGYLIRPDNKHAKAGNLNHALTKTTGEYIAIFDCDHVPTRSFLQMTMGWFLRDEKLAMVQTPHHFYSADPFEKNLGTFRSTPNEGQLFYGLIQPNNDLWDAAFFCGSCAVLRRSALAEIDGIAVETVTEDAHTALKLHRKGYSTAYLDVPQAAGLATESLSAHVGQRIRWARGMAQIFRIDNPFLGRGLSLAQRLCYAGSMSHFFYGIPRMIFLIAPVFFLVFDLHVFNALPLVVLAHWLPHMAHSLLTTWRIQGKFRHSLWSEVYETCLAFYIAIPTTMALIFPKSGSFNVTAKGGQVDRIFFDRKIAGPYLAFAALNLLAFGYGLYRLVNRDGMESVLGINLIWSSFNLMILAATLGLAWEKRQQRRFPRVELKAPAMVRLASGHTFRAELRDLSMGGARIEVSGERNFVGGELLDLSIFLEREEVPFPARVIAQSGRSLRMQFRKLSLREEEALVRALFSRANAWTDWSDAQGASRPSAALLLIMRQGVTAIARFFVRPSAPKAEASR